MVEKDFSGSYYLQERQEYKDIVLATLEIETCRRLMTQSFSSQREILQEEPTAMFDMDGVVIRSDSPYNNPQPTNDRIITAIQALQQQGVRIGVATARSLRVVDDLQRLGIYVNGPLICEEGQVCKDIQGNIRTLGHPEHPRFIQSVLSGMKENLKNNWEEVVKGEPFSLCLGDPQWLGERRLSLWAFPDSIKDYSQDDYNELLMIRLKEFLKGIAVSHGLSYKNDLIVKSGVTKLQGLPLTFISITGQYDYREISKGLCAKFVPEALPKAWVSFGDGPGDDEFCFETQDRPYGLSIGVRKSLDKRTFEVKRFLARARLTVADPYDLAIAIEGTVQDLSKAA